MPEGIVIKLTGTLSLLFLSLMEVHPQDSVKHPVRIMFYNVENLFDVYNDTATDDDEFLPDGVRRWNYYRYERKINALYKTILAAGEWSPPQIVAFCEVENRKVLEDLVYGTYLSKYNYKIIHHDSPDPRGIDVCLIYRKDFVDVIDWRYILPPSEGEENIETRSVLYSKCLVSGDTVHLFVNHWPSRRGGVLAGESLRKRIAGLVKDMADSIAAAESTEARIIILGDFNATSDDMVISTLTGKYSSGVSMINLSATLAAGTGTYRYKGTWEMIDQIIVSGGLLNSRRDLYLKPESLSVFNADFLQKKDPVYPGLSPLSTWAGYSYQGGYSDHLPVLLDLMIK